jgi:hypothetical protein
MILATFRRKSEVREERKRRAGAEGGSQNVQFGSGIQESNKTFLRHIVLDGNGG